MSSGDLKSFFDVLPGGFLLTDTRSQVLYANEAVVARTGFSLAETVGKRPGDLWGGHMPRSFYASMWRAITKGEPFSGDAFNRTKEGKVNEETMFIAPIHDQAGALAMFAEIRPHFSSTEEKLRFQQEFLAEGRGLSKKARGLEWILSSLTKGKIQHAPSLHRQSLSDFLRESLITPTERLFARRAEDMQLIRNAQAHPEQFSLLYEKYAPMCRRYFSRRLGEGNEVVNDLVQDTFYRAFASFRSFQVSNASYYTYLLHIAHNVLVNYFRKEQHFRFEELESVQAEEAPQDEACGDDSRARTALLRLSESERKAFQWKAEGFSVREIAERMGRTENAVKLLMSRARKKLKT